MQQRALGKTGILVSTLGLGTVKIGRNQGLKFPTGFEIPDDKAVLALLDQAQDLGINLLDTAPAYGNSESRLGKLLKKRTQWVISTKVGEIFENGQSRFDFSAEYIRASVQQSLKRLNTDYLDLVLLHSDGNDIYNIEHFGVLESLADIKAQGLIRAYGMSTKTVEGGLMALAKSDVVMACYNPVYTEELAVLKKAETENKGILIKKALMSGHLNQLPGEDPVKTALQFILQEPAVSSVILGTINTQHLTHAAQCLYAAKQPR